MVPDDPGAGRDFGGTLTGFVVGYLQREAPLGTVDRVLAACGETRSAEELADPSTWSSYAQMRRLLEASCAILGGAEAGCTIGAYALDSLAGPEVTELFYSLGSPHAVLDNLAIGTAAVSPASRFDAEHLESGGSVVRFGLVDGFDPFPEYCAFISGLMTCVPKLFGFTTTESVEYTCQCRGDDSCALRLRWTEGAADAAIEHDAFRARLFEARLVALQQTVAELVSGEGLELVLPQIISAAARAVHAPSYVLSLDDQLGAGRRLYCDGIEEAQAEALMATLSRSPESAEEHVLSVRVSSAGTTYGHLAAVRLPGSRFDAHEVTTLGSYASLAAAALDSALALDKARSEANTTKALLELSSSLGELGAPEDLTARIAAAVPSVIDCDRAVVVLFDHAGGPDRSIATFGYDQTDETLVHAWAASVPGPPEGSEVIWHDPALPSPGPYSPPPGLQSALGVTIVMRLAGETIGWVCADVMHQAERLRGQPDLAVRLHGLASHLSVALSNARLLEEIRHQSLHDALTGLPNRTLILDRTEQMLSRARRNNDIEIALLFIDLDSFKNVNDTFGHEAGDELLRAVAMRFMGVVRAVDTVGRLGGDEFVVICEGQTPASGASVMAKRLLGALDEPFFLERAGRVPTTVSASIGVAIGVRDTAHDLLRDGDVALYAAKAAGKHRYAVFESQMGSAIRSHHQLDMELRGALGSKQFFLVYQPTLELRDMRVTGVEALLRWRHPTRGVIGPDDFIATLEESGMIVEVGRWVLAEACREARRWHDQGYPVDLSVNVSGRQLEADVLVADVRAALGASSLPPSALIVEMTETSLMRNPNRAVRQLRSLRSLGVRVAIDDFGTGYSSLGRLGQLPVDSIKIDRSFVSGASEAPESSVLLRTLLQLGKALHLETLAEGIEEPEQLRVLQDEQCDSGQGFLFARPMAAREMDRYLQTGASVASHPGTDQLTQR